MLIIFLIGRILFGGFFLYNAYNHLVKSDMLAGYAASKGLPKAKLMTIVSGIMLLLGGVAIIANFYFKLGALLLILFLIPTTFIMHAFWKEKDPMAKAGERVAFAKNIAILAALLMFFAL